MASPTVVHTLLSIVIVFRFNLLCTSNSVPVTNSFYFGSEYLDSQQKYLMSWNISGIDKRIDFEVTALTAGFIGFGISPNGEMNGSDILIAGVNSNGSLYSSDYHGVGNAKPIVDSNQNWNVSFGQENSTHTTLHFSRLLNTCDDDDMEITDGTMRLIWAFGETDDIIYHYANRGSKSVNLYLQNEYIFDPEKYNKADLSVATKMPSEHTAYWCTVHKAPVQNETHHIVAFETILDNLPALQHVHHLILTRCVAPEWEDPATIFEPRIGHPGDYCYEHAEWPYFPFYNYCDYPVYVWSKGGQRLVFPPNLGLPMPSQPGQPEYYGLAIHYDNPKNLADMEFRTGVRIYYTAELREIEVGTLRIHQEVQDTAQLTIPPLSPDFIVAAHCSGICTEQFLPAEGVTVFNSLFHTHLTGRKLKLRHFRGDEELPWVDKEDYFDGNYQQNKPVWNYRRVQRGDQLTVECTYDTRGVEGGKAVVGGLSTREEMCEAVLYYYPRQDFTECRSGQWKGHLGLLGITNMKLKLTDIHGEYAYDILEPPHLAGDYRESLSFKVNWTREVREEFQELTRYEGQRAYCRGVGSDYEGGALYPEDLKVYVPPNECEGETEPPPVTTTTTSPPPQGFEEWVMENIQIVQAKLQKLQESVDFLIGNQTLRFGPK